MKKIINYFKNLRVSTIYKLVGVILLIGIITWMIVISNKTEKLALFKSKTKNVTTLNKNKNESNVLKENDIQQTDNSVEKIENEEKKVSESITNKNNNQSSSNKSPEKEPSTEVTNSIDVVEKESADDVVISFLNDTNNNLEDINLRDKAKENFILIVDFLFYNGKIKGYTFDELTTKAKLSVIKLALTIDNKIDSYFPDYKEKISEKTNKLYTSVKELAITKYLEITTSICIKDPETCEQAKQDFQDMKKSFSITWNFIKNIASTSKENIKTWYEIYSGK